MADLEQWRINLVTAVIPRMISVNIFSPEWLQIFQDTFGAYDKVESEQRERSEPRLGWQNMVEEKRKTWEQEYKFRDEEPPAATSVLHPLAKHLCYHLNDNDTSQRLYQWKSMLENWNLFQLLYGEQDDETTRTFRNSLSYTQHASYGILNDWWQALYCDPELINSVKTYLNQRLDDTSYPEGFEKIDAEATSIHNSLYHASCLKLFYLEFNPYVWNPYLWRNTLLQLNEVRATASMHATMQRCATTFVPQSLDCLSARLAWKPYTGLISKSPVWHRPSEHEHLPRYLWDTVARRTVLVNTLSESPSYTCISHTWGRWRHKDVSISIAGVPWQVPTNSLYNVSDLPDILASLSLRYVWLDLFCIPQDGSTAADVEIGRQTSIFGRANDCIAWLHDVSSWQGTRKALTWMSIRYLQHTNRFAASRAERLHRDAQAAWTEANIAHAELVPVSWKKAATWYQMLQNVNSPNPFPGNNELLAISHGSVAEPATWFSSLWTLQEAILSPNLRLCSRSFEPLIDGSGQSLSLSVLIHVLSSIKDYVSLGRLADVAFVNPSAYDWRLFQRGRNTDLDTWPGSARCLWELDAQTSLGHALKTSFPTDILMNAGNRQCTGSRAEAIMSAVDATDWFNQHVVGNRRQDKRGWTSSISRPQKSDGIMLDIFPLPFVQEVARKAGAAFYNSLGPKWDKRLPLSTAWGGDQAIGSMLQFGVNKEHAGMSFDSAPWFPDANIGHESVEGWSICQTGSVQMPMAAIADSSHKALSKAGRPARIMRTSPRYEEELNLDPDPNVLVYETQNLHQSLAEIATQELTAFGNTRSGTSAPRIYAVCLYQSPFNQYGILLLSPNRRKFPRRLGGKRYLIKIGLYQNRDRQMPPSQNVNWVVL